MSKLKLFVVCPSKRFFLLFIFFFSSLAVEAQNGLIKAMSFEYAEEIAIKSIRRASGIRVREVDFKLITTNGDLAKLIKKDKYTRNCLDSTRLIAILKNGKENPADPLTNIAELDNLLNVNCFPLKRLRLTDKLDFLGITDEFRLAALRRYIVRNSELGVKSVWGSDENGVAHFFVISGKQIEDVTTSTTVLDLAKKIQSAAALPFLSYGSAELLVRNCRNKVAGKKDKLVIDEKTFISVDLGNSNTERFITCLENDVLRKGDPVTFEDANAKESDNLKRYKYGVQSVRVVDNEGDNKFYYLTHAFQTKLKDRILKESLTYQVLLNELVKSAGISASDDFLATRMVVNSLLNIAEEKNTNKSIRLFRPLKLHRVSEILLNLRQSGCNSPLPDDGISVENTLKSLCVSPASLISKIKVESTKNSSAYLLLTKVEQTKVKPTQDEPIKRLVSIEQITLPEKITDESTIKQVIEAVEEIIKKQRKARRNSEEKQ